MAPTIEARLFGPGMPAAGTPVVLARRGEELSLAGEAGVGVTVAAAGVTLARAGFDERALALRWRDSAGVWEAQLAPLAADQLLAAPPAAWVEKLGALDGEGRRRRRGRALGWTAIGLWLLAPLVALALFIVNIGAIVGLAASHIGIASEVNLGAVAFAQLQPRLTLLTEEQAAQRLVGELGGRLTAGSRYRYRWYVAEEPSVNAFALPGGIIVVHTGLIAAAADVEELAGVLAHEIQHVELRHSLRNLLQGLGLRALLGLALGDWGGTAEAAAAQLSELKFSRDAEREADRGGFDLLRLHDIDPAGLARFFAKLANKDGLNPAFLSSHPTSQERLEALRALAAAAPARNYPKLDYPWPPAAANRP